MVFALHSRHIRARPVAAGLVLACMALSEPARAETAELESLRPARGFSALDRPHGIAEFGFGWLTLPTAEVCVDPERAGCSRGDTTPGVDVWQLYRPNTAIAFGAGATLGLIPTQTAPRSDPEGVLRDHTRRYLLVEVTTRYYPYVARHVEAWLGIATGLVVVNDRFAASHDFGDRALIGPRAVTIRTEGFSIGLSGGVVLALAEQWALGGVLRYGSWFLPETPNVDPLGDEASLTGQNSMFSLGINVAYRLAL